MSKHTPGPWRLEIDESPHEGNSVMSADGKEVIRNGGYDQYNECSESDARLIAAAPEMLLLLKAAVEGNLGGEWYRLVLEIIAKAEIETNERV